MPRMKDDELLGALAEDIGITRQRIDEMKVDEVRDLFGELDQVARVRLVRGRLSRLRDELELCDEVLLQAADDAAAKVSSRHRPEVHSSG